MRRTGLKFRDIDGMRADRAATGRDRISHARSIPKTPETTREEHILSLTISQKRAFELVDFFLTALGIIASQKGNGQPMSDQLHEVFVAFAKAMGQKGKFYRLTNKECLAVNLYVGPWIDGSIILIDLDSRSFGHRRKKFDALPPEFKAQIMKAAEVAYKVWDKLTG